MPVAERGVLVAGGSGALGTAVLGALLEAGHAVTSTWIVDAERDRVAGLFPDASRLSLVQADVTDPADVDRAVAVVPELGAVINLVGGYAQPGRVHETDPAAFQAMLELNLVPGFLLARAAMPRLVGAGGGAFVCVSARAALRPFSGAAGYITAKAGVLAFTKALDAEYRDDGIRCNAVLPGVIDTPANRAANADADFSRWVTPEAVADVIAFLVSERSVAITGAGVPVAGRS
ncbi:MAG: SDR family NAD(P)-dependent oxidoreductase [Actinomycetes bacterium]